MAKYEKKMKLLENELQSLHEEQSEKKQNEIVSLKEKNLHLDSYDKKMEELLKEKIDEAKLKEEQTLNSIKQEYELKVKAYKDKYKDLEEKEFKFLESEYNECKEKMHLEYKRNVSNLENRLKESNTRIEREVSDTFLLRACIELVIINLIKWSVNIMECSMYSE